MAINHTKNEQRENRRHKENHFVERRTPDLFENKIGDNDCNGQRNQTANHEISQRIPIDGVAGLVREGVEQGDKVIKKGREESSRRPIPILHHPIKVTARIAFLKNQKDGIDIDGDPHQKEVGDGINQHQNDEEIRRPILLETRFAGKPYVSLRNQGRHKLVA
jgi:hypothetical protein